MLNNIDEKNEVPHRSVSAQILYWVLLKNIEVVLLEKQSRVM